MRTTRALIAGFGTTGTLVAAVACVFLVASAVVAFNGWLGSGIGDKIDSLFVNDQPAVAFDASGPQVVAGGATAAAGSVAAVPSGPVVAAPGGSGSSGPGGSGTTGGGGGGNGGGGSGSGGGGGGPGTNRPGRAGAPRS